MHIAAASFCHTDTQVYEGAYKTKLPFTGSHEPAGTIAALGPDVSGGWKVGDRVGVYLFRNPCGKCSDCKWYASSHDGKLYARYCDNKVMGGIRDADGGFAEYMLTEDYALVRIPDAIPFEQAAPLMCAGCTIFTAVLEAGLQEGQTVAIVGIGGLGLLGIQFAKALGYRVAAVHHRDNRSKLDTLPEHLRPDIFVVEGAPDTIDRLTEFSEGRGLDAAVICVDTTASNDWVLHRLHPRGTAVLLGLNEDGFRFDAFNVVFREIKVKGSLHSSVEDMARMLDIVAKQGVHSEISVVPLDEAEALPSRVHAHEFSGRPVVKMC